jgi:hypothetical protein
MKRDDRLQTFLDAATAGLKDDREIQLSVQAELASHVEAALRERSSAGMSDAEATAEALRTLGPATDVAADLVAANRRHMKMRARLRVAARALLVPLAVVLAVLAFLPVANVLRYLQLNSDGPIDVTPFMSILSASDSLPQRALTEQKRLILHGDPKRKGAAQQQRAIWEASPTNLVYLGNYITVLTADYDTLADAPDKRWTVYTNELELAEATEPDNARFHYLRASKLLAESATMKPREEKGTSQYDLVLAITNEARLEQAMEEFRAGLGKPYFRRYGSEMMAERLSILGPPQDMVQQIKQIGMVAGQLLPDLSGIRNLARSSALYAERLINEGRQNEALSFLNAPERLSAELYQDSYTLIDLLVACAVAGIGTNMVPPLYEKLGDPAMAAQARERSAMIAGPMHNWRVKRKANENPAAQEVMRTKGGILVGLLLPALNEYPSEADYRPGRLIEYTIADRTAMGVLTFVFLVAMFGALVVTLRWRFARGGASAPILLLPAGREMLRILGLGVLLPLLAFYPCSLWPPISGRNYGLSYVWPKAVLQLTAVGGAITLLTTLLSARAVRRRCRRLDVDVPQDRLGRVYFCLLTAMVAMAGVVSFLPAAWLTAGSGLSVLLAVGVAGTVLACIGIGAFAAFGVGLACSRQHGLYYGTVARSLIPCLALAVIVLSLLPGFCLRQQERSLFRQDTLIGMDPNGGFTKIEARLVQRLKQEALQAIDSLEPPP